METIHVTFDELTEQISHVQSSPGPAPNLLTPGPISSRLVPNPAPAIPYVPPINKELEMLFQPMFDEYFNPPGIRQDPIPNAAQDPVIPTGPSVSIAIDLDTASGSHISSPLDHHSSSVHHGVAGEQYAKVNPFAADDPEPFVNVFALDYNSKASLSREITIPESSYSNLPHEHIQKWTDSHPLDNIIRNPSRPVSTRKQLATDALWCCYGLLTCIAGEQYTEVNPFAAADPEPFVNVFALDSNSEASSSREITIPESNKSTLPHEHIRKWTDSHPLDNIIRNPS
ncbi:hypothetical protein Tco_0809919 [Tanacetum coccineum]